MKRILQLCLIAVAVGVTACQRTKFDLANTPAPRGAPAYSFEPNENIPPNQK